MTTDQDLDESALRSEFVCAKGVDDRAVAVLHEECLLALREALDVVFIDLISDGPWPAAVVPDLELLMSRVPTGKSPVGVEVRPTEQAAFAAVARLAAHSINVDGHSRREVTRGVPRPLYFASDTGSSLWCALTAAERRYVDKRLAARGVDPHVLVPFVPRERLVRRLAGEIRRLVRRSDRSR